MSRTMVSSEYAVVRSDIQTLVEEMGQKASTDARLANQFRRIELSLIFFADAMVVESNLRFSQQWQQEPLGYERNELAGDQKFFDLLEEALNDSSEEATERLAVYYTCLGLGFTGWYTGQPEQLRKLQNQIYSRVRHLDLVESDPTQRLCKEAYESVDMRDLREPPSSKLVLILLFFLVCGLSVMVFYFWAFRDASAALRHSLESISQQDKTPVSEGVR
jgi:type IV/VI secretion system ImpK/VasF family protein